MCSNQLYFFKVTIVKVFKVKLLRFSHYYVNKHQHLLWKYFRLKLIYSRNDCWLPTKWRAQKRNKNPCFVVVLLYYRSPTIRPHKCKRVYQKKKYETKKEDLKSWEKYDMWLNFKTDDEGKPRCEKENWADIMRVWLSKPGPWDRSTKCSVASTVEV